MGPSFVSLKLPVVIFILLFSFFGGLCPSILCSVTPAVSKIHSKTDIFELIALKKGVKAKQMQKKRWLSVLSSQIWHKVDSTVLTALPSECANWMYWLGANVSKRWEQDGSTLGAGDLVAVRAGVRTGGVNPPPPPPPPPSLSLCSALRL